MSSAPIVFVVDDDSGSRESTCALISQIPFQTKSFSSAEEFLANYDGHRPAVLLTDHRMSGMSGVELVERLRHDGVSLAAVIMTAFARTDLTVRAIRSGAVTLLEKPFGFKGLQEALQQALTEDRAQSVNDAKLRQISSQLDSLTEGELEVVKRIVRGRPNKTVASELDVSIRTVESRRSRVFQKMNVKSVAELVQLTMIARPEICLGDDDQLPGDPGWTSQPVKPDGWR